MAGQPVAGSSGVVSTAASSSTGPAADVGIRQSVDVDGAVAQQVAEVLLQLAYSASSVVGDADDLGDDDRAGRERGSARR